MVLKYVQYKTVTAAISIYMQQPMFSLIKRVWTLKIASTFSLMLIKLVTSVGGSIGLSFEK